MTTILRIVAPGTISPQIDDARRQAMRDRLKSHITQAILGGQEIVIQTDGDGAKPDGSPVEVLVQYINSDTTDLAVEHRPIYFRSKTNSSSYVPKPLPKKATEYETYDNSKNIAKVIFMKR